MKLNWLKIYAIVICIYTSVVHGQSSATSHNQADPFIAAVLGAIPLTSGFYLTTSPQKGIVFTLADLVLIGTVVSIRRDSAASQKDVPMYYGLIAAVNIADLVFSVMQVKSDEAARIKLTLNPLDQPGFKLAWQF